MASRPNRARNYRRRVRGTRSQSGCASTLRCWHRAHWASRMHYDAEHVRRIGTGGRGQAPWTRVRTGTYLLKQLLLSPTGWNLGVLTPGAKSRRGSGRRRILGARQANHLLQPSRGPRRVRISPTGKSSRQYRKQRMHRRESQIWALNGCCERSGWQQFAQNLQRCAAVAATHSGEAAYDR